MFRVEKNQIFLFLALAAFSFSILAGDYAVVRHFDGRAFVQGSASGERESLTLNSPIFEGDNIWLTEGNMGILFGDGSLIWLSTGSHLEISRFPDPVADPPGGMRVHLWRGILMLEVPASLPGESSHLVMTPAASVKSFRKSLSIVEVETVDRTRLTVLDGSSLIGSSGQYQMVAQGEMSYAEYGYEPMSPASVGAGYYPEIADFRDRNISRPVKNGRSREYVDPELYPYADDLDYYGSWRSVPAYGHVWFPSPAYLGAGWNPYYNGYWHYTPWGTTWISYEPWGWVPFHYGRWTFVIGVGWGWIPDVFFSPAWVSWYWGDGWIGWCPLGYYGPLWEPCGWYSVTINNIYVTNVTKVVNVNKHGPPPGKPIIPVSKHGADGPVIKKLQHKNGGDILVTPHGGLNLQPAQLRDLQSRKISADDLKRTLADPPVSTRDMRIATRSSLDRQDDPVIGKKPGTAPPASSTRETPSGPRARDSWDRSVDTPSRVSPSRTEPPVSSDTGSRIYRDDRSEPSSRDREYPSRGLQRNDEPSRESPPAREAPSRDVPVQREQPRTTDTPRSDRSTGSDRHVSPPPSSSQPPSPPPSSSDTQSRPSKQKSSAGESSGSGTKAAASSRTSGGGKTKSTASSSSGSGSSSSESRKKQK
ncbi:MAG TPA: hypothetical protein PKJ37_04705 [Acidobacteriota bacterium]|nr:hypothetical protein [Acidobacteriota bacterium]HNT17183.1 hypothetical protein [Acidobacteriota bacterium]